MNVAKRLECAVFRRFLFLLCSIENLKGKSNPKRRNTAHSKRFARSVAILCCALVVSCLPQFALGGETLFEDQFKNKLGKGWSWIRENPQAWRVTNQGLEVRIEPGNMWGPQNNAKNLLIRPLPAAAATAIQISVRVENKPTHQYEQVDLVWYYDDSHMVKLGQELVDGKLSVVMGREENDKTRTISITPLDSQVVFLRIIAKENHVRGQFRTRKTSQWREVGECDMPVPSGTPPRVCLQFYQGPEKEEHWAKVTDFRIAK
jgi:regulation of enolase protein 1 (concanavalin A-like superfamily)